MSRSKSVPIICLLLALAPLAIYYQIHEFEFVRWDDYAYVVDNPNVTPGLSPEGLRWALTAGEAGNWHPMTWVAHMIDCELYGLNPAGHHLGNLALHVFNTWILFGLLVVATRRVWPCALAAALFAVHPFQAETVAWVAERKNLLSLFFGLLSLWAYVRYARRGRTLDYVAAWFLFALGLMAKPQLVTLPFVLLLLDRWPLERRGGWTEKLPFFAAAVGSSVVTWLVQMPAQESRLQVELPSRLANAAVSYVRYLWKALVPTDLAFLYPHPDLPGGTPWDGWQVLASAVLLVAISIVIRWGRKPYLIFGWLWFLGTLVPMIGVVQVGVQAMADRYTYLPMIGIYVGVAWGLAELASRWLPRGTAARGGLALVVLIGLGLSSWTAARQAGSWRDSRALFERGLEIAPRHPRIHQKLGDLARRDGRLPDAIQHFRDALRNDPESPGINSLLGLGLARSGRIAEAEPFLEAAARLDPTSIDHWANLAILRTVQERWADAEVAVRKALDAAEAAGNQARVKSLRVRLQRLVQRRSEMP